MIVQLVVEPMEHYTALVSTLTSLLCQIVKMFGVVTSVFALCWLPYHAYFIIIHYHPGIMRAW